HSAPGRPPTPSWPADPVVAWRARSHRRWVGLELARGCINGLAEDVLEDRRELSKAVVFLSGPQKIHEPLEAVPLDEETSEQARRVEIRPAEREHRGKQERALK